MATPGIAVPGSNVPTSSLVATGGAQGIPGIKGSAPYTTTLADFTMPAPGGSVNVTVADASWIIVGEMVVVQTAGGSPTTAASMRCTAVSGNVITLQYNPPATFPLASTAGSGLMATLSGNTTDFVDGTNACQNLANAVVPLVTPSITSVRLRSFNAIGNPNMEIGQIDLGSVQTIAGAAVRAADRWMVAKSGMATMVATSQRFGSTAMGGVYQVPIPGTSFFVTNAILRITLTTAQPTLAAADLLWLNQQIEGIYFRELQGDVHSCSLLVRSSVAGLKFGIAFRDGGTPSQSLVKLATIPSANTWVVLPFPNLPIWPNSGAFASGVGNVGYQFSITLACGSQYTAPANDTWQGGNFVGAIGQSNFAASPVNSTFDIAFIQHEPGSQCTQLIDKPWIQNYRECLRYYEKSYDYNIPLATNNANSLAYAAAEGGQTWCYPVSPFMEPKARIPTVTIWGANGSTTQIDQSIIAWMTLASPSTSGVSTKSIGQINFTTAMSTTSWNPCHFHYAADTTW